MAKNRNKAILEVGKSMYSEMNMSKNIFITDYSICVDQVTSPI